MTEQEFLQKWEQEEPMYHAWGDFVSSGICKKLIDSGQILSTFLKQPCNPRTKNTSALIDKAFYRKKNYDNPYDDIEDKVGCRFVVLLVEHIDVIVDVIKACDEWSFEECRHFSNERDSAPLLFTYQSVHYVVRSKRPLTHKETVITEGTPCEIQIRTLLQHAYAELTHDAVYKAKTIVEPKVHRTIAKSMALIETTDDFFSEVNQNLNKNNFEENHFQSELDSLYTELVGLNPTSPQKSSLVIMDTFQENINENTIGTLQRYFEKNSDILEAIRQGRNTNPMYSQSIVLFIAWLIKKKKRIVKGDWPITHRVLEILATNFGESFDF